MKKLIIIINCYGEMSNCFGPFDTNDEAEIYGTRAVKNESRGGMAASHSPNYIIRDLIEPDKRFITTELVPKKEQE